MEPSKVPIRFRDLRFDPMRKGCSVIVTAAYGLEHSAKAWFISARMAPTAFHSRTASRATTSTRYSRTAKAASGSERPKASIGFARIQFQRSGNAKAFRLLGHRPLWLHG